MIYLDNAATSFPKPPMVVRAMAGTLQKLGGNPGRSGHALSLCGGRIIQRCRELLAEAFDAPAPENVIFFPSCTEALSRLRAWQNRRRSSRRTGALPERIAVRLVLSEGGGQSVPIELSPVE